MGYLQTDDYAGYNAVENVTRVGCFAHARRYYTDALKALPKEAAIENTHAHEALCYFKRFFKLEKQWMKEGLSAAERFEKRKTDLKPELEAYLTWLHAMEPQVVKKSKFGQAIAYILSNWDLLTNVLKDGQCELSTNLAEQRIKPYVIGRENYLFCKMPHGAKASAVVYSIIETAKLHKPNPFRNLTYLFEELRILILMINGLWSTCCLGQRHYLKNVILKLKRTQTKSKAVLIMYSLISWSRLFFN